MRLLTKPLCVAVHQKQATRCTGQPCRIAGSNHSACPKPCMLPHNPTASALSTKRHLRKLLCVAVHQKKATRCTGQPCGTAGSIHSAGSNKLSGDCPVSAASHDHGDVLQGTSTCDSCCVWQSTRRTPHAARASRAALQAASTAPDLAAFRVSARSTPPGVPELSYGRAA